MIDWLIRVHPEIGVSEDVPLPVVAECNDQFLNDTQGRHVHSEEIPPLLDAARPGDFARGSAGAGTGMRAFQFKAGIGSASRKLPPNLGGYTLGVLVNANTGLRRQLVIAGVPVGKILANSRYLPVFPRRMTLHGRATDGSIIVVVGTDAPVDARVLHAICKRTAMGLARTGLTSQISSGDLMLAFSTTNVTPRDAEKASVTLEREESKINALYNATVDATESAIYDALWNGTTMTGVSGRVMYALPHDRLRALLAR